VKERKIPPPLFFNNAREGLKKYRGGNAESDPNQRTYPQLEAAREELLLAVVAGTTPPGGALESLARTPSSHFVPNKRKMDQKENPTASQTPGQGRNSGETVANSR